MSVTISVSGVEKIDKILKGLPNQVNHLNMSKIHTLAAQPLVERAKLLAPLGETMNLTKSIGTVKEPFGRSDSLGVVRAGARRGSFRGNHAHLLEYGTAVRRTKSGANRGVGPKKPFMEKAWLSTRKQVENIIAFQVSKYIVNFIKQNA